MMVTNHRTPVGKRASTMVVQGRFMHDVKAGYQPIQFYATKDNPSGLEGGFPLLSDGSIGANRHVTAIGNYFEPGKLSGTGQVSASFIAEPNDSSSVTKMHGKRNRFDDTLAASNFSRSSAKVRAQDLSRDGSPPWACRPLMPRPPEHPSRRTATAVRWDAQPDPEMQRA